MEAAYSTETSADIRQTTQDYVPEAIRNRRRENPKSYMICSTFNRDV